MVRVYSFLTFNSKNENGLGKNNMTRDRDQAIYYYIWRLLVLCSGRGPGGRAGAAVPILTHDIDHDDALLMLA